MALTQALRFAVLQGLGRAQERVAHGAPTLHASLHYLKLSERAWWEVDRAVDEVRFTVPAEELEATALSEGGASAEGRRLREDLATARRNAHLSWSACQENTAGATRAQCVALLFIAREFLKRLPTVSAGPLIPSLPINRSQA